MKRNDLIPSPFFLGFGISLPLPFMVLAGVAWPPNGLLGVLGVALMLVGLYRMARGRLGALAAVGLDPGSPSVQRCHRVATLAAAEEAHRALLEAGEDPRAADSLRNRIRGLADLKAL